MKGSHRLCDGPDHLSQKCQFEHRKFAEWDFQRILRGVVEMRLYISDTSEMTNVILRMLDSQNGGQCVRDSTATRERMEEQDLACIVCH